MFAEALLMTSCKMRRTRIMKIRRKALSISLITVMLLCMVGIVGVDDSYAAGSSFATATQINASTTNTSGTLSGSNHFYKFKPVSGKCKLIISGTSKTASLYNDSQSLIASCTDSKNTGAKTKEVFLLGGSWYYIKVSGGSGYYTLGLSFVKSGETYTETATSKYDSFNNAKQIELNGLCKGQLGYGDSSDAYSFNAPHNGVVKIEQFWVAASDTPSIMTGTIYDSSREKITSFQTKSNTDGAIESIDVNRGDYYFIVNDGSGGYYFRISFKANESEHKYGNWVITKEASCTENGKREKVCSICNEKKTETIEKSHKWNKSYTVDLEPTCTEEGSESIHCSICGETKEGSSRTVPQKHSYGAWETIKKSTELAPGLKTHTCTECGKEETAAIKQLKPSLPAVAILAPTPSKKSATIKWKTISKANQKKIASLQIQYSMDRNFKKGVKTVAANKTTVSKKITKLASKKKYYVRIRTYKKDNKGVHISKWSAVKSVTVK